MLKKKQGHRQNGDQAARQRYMMCSICRCRCTSVWGTWGPGMGSFDSPPMESNRNAPHWHIWSISERFFELFTGLQKHFRPSVRPSVLPGYDDKYRARSYCFVERQKAKVVVEILLQPPICEFCQLIFLLFRYIHQCITAYYFLIHPVCDIYNIHSRWLTPSVRRQNHIGLEFSSLGPTTLRIL